MDPLAGRDPSITREAFVVLHVARSEGRVDHGRVFELGEDRLVALSEDVREHVQTTAMRHPEDDLAHPEGRGVLDDVIEERDQGLSPLEREALLPQELRMEEALEELGRRELLEDASPLPIVEVRMILGLLHQLPEPRLAARVLDMRELDADRTAIGLSEPGQDLPKRLHGAARQIARDEGLVEVSVAESVVSRIELREIGRLAAEGIALCDAMAPRAVRMDQAEHPGMLVRDVKEVRVIADRSRSGSGGRQLRHASQVRLRRRLDRGSRRPLGRGLHGAKRRKTGGPRGLRPAGSRPGPVRELLGPALVDRAGIDPEAIVDLLHPARVDPETAQIGRARRQGLVGIELRLARPGSRRRLTPAGSVFGPVRCLIPGSARAPRLLHRSDSPS